MPSRTYVGIDFINYATSFFTNTGTHLAIATLTNKFDVSVNATGAGTNPPSTQVNNTFSYLISGDLNFNAFPAIPDDAQITRIEVKVDLTLTGVASANAVTATAVIDNDVLTYRGVFPAGTLLPNLNLSQLVTSGPSAAPSASGTVFDHYTASQIFDFSGSPITKAQLVTDYTSWFVNLQNSSGSSITAGPGTMSLNTTVTIDGIRIIITYGSGPQVSPAGGNVEVGQPITITGQNVAENTYAAVINDKIIPLEFKVISPTEIEIEIPYPPTDACFDCFGTCPECDDCFTVCEEDLTGTDCQECMDACLDCLVECLESLELAEECQESTGSDPDVEIPIVILAGGPGFSGSVPLANFIILVSNGSGIYRFVLGKTNDTVYTAARDGTTYDVKIPNPGAKTGFFRS